MASPLRDGSFDVAETRDSSHRDVRSVRLAPPKLALAGNASQGSSLLPLKFR